MTAALPWLKNPLPQIRRVYARQSGSHPDGLGETSSFEVAQDRMGLIR